jgi:hypothetical protein
MPTFKQIDMILTLQITGTECNMWYNQKGLHFVKYLVCQFREGNNWSSEPTF